jgi:hypothetical protein
MARGGRALLLGAGGRSMPTLASPAPDGHRAQVDGAGAGDLRRDVLPPRAGALAQGQHDGADHGDEQHEAGRLEEVHVIRVEDAARAPRRC